MPLVQRILFALRVLLEDESPPTRKKKRRSSSGTGSQVQTRQAAALVLTFKDLFASGHLNLILEDIERNKASPTKNKCSSKLQKSRISIGQPSASSSPKVLRNGESVSSGTGQNSSMATPSVWPLVIEGIDESVPLLREERIISCTRIDFESIDKLLAKRVASRLSRNEDRAQESTSKTVSCSTGEKVTVSLSPDDEKETVAVLRKVFKWSPRKQSAVTFEVPLTKKEEHKAVAAVQNAVNRVKEENFKKKKKWKFPKLSLC
ncbi:uncharacterized protein [Parasteatoda tepidariorum]|uniref:uncharacterized protein n=1 Tax=Parasteatoda tepidariorum TaxID=114398 RepID=UPI001C71F0F9|nr:uncharacterized protein LOC107449110 [Parasteatoda tepidariorum]